MPAHIQGGNAGRGEHYGLFSRRIAEQLKQGGLACARPPSDEDVPPLILNHLKGGFEVAAKFQWCLFECQVPAILSLAGPMMDEAVITCTLNPLSNKG